MRGTTFWCPQNRSVRIGNRFQASHARRDDEQAQQKCPVRADPGGWNEPEGTCGNQRQPHEDATLVTEFLRNQTGGDCHQEVGEVVGCLHQA